MTDCIPNWTSLLLPDHPHRQFNHGDSSELGAKPWEVINAINTIAGCVNASFATMQDALTNITLTAGPQGPKGDTGATGSNGSNGSAGAAATITIGTVTGLTAGATPTVTNTGSATAAQLNFGIPAGAAGTPGAAGSNGTNGTNGAAGATGSAGVNAFGTPNSKTLAFATAIQATDPTKPAVISAMIEAAYTLTIASTLADEVELRIGPVQATVANGTAGTAVATFKTSLTGILVSVGMGMIQRNQLTAHLPVGWYYAVRRVSGTTATIQAAFDQSVG